MSEDIPVPPPQPSVPAGWYSDPHNPAEQRYWSGHAWTEHRAPHQLADSVEPTQVLPLGTTRDSGRAAGTSPNAPTRVPGWWRKPWVLVAGGVMVGATLVAWGSSGPEDPTPAAAVVPAPTATVTATVTATEQVTVETTVTATPKPKPKPKAKPTAEAGGSQPNGSGKGTGGATFVVPNEVGKNLQIAQDDLQEASGDPFFVSFSEDATGADRFQLLDSGWQVCSQAPAAGTRIGLYDDVTLYVVRNSESCP